MFRKKVMGFIKGIDWLGVGIAVVIATLMILMMFKIANTSYIAPTIAAILKEYRTYSYTYVLHANELNEMKSSFAELEAAGTVTNQQLSIW